MSTVKRYRINKEQLERVVESFVMEAASIEGKKAPVKNHIPSQSVEAKKHIKNKMSGKMVEKGEGVPNPEKPKKKLPQAADAKKHISKAKVTHSNKAKIVREHYSKELMNEGVGEMWDKLMKWMGHRWDQKKAEQAWNQVYVKNAEKMSKAYANGDVQDFKNAVMKFMKANAGLPILDGGGKNAEWNDEEKEFKRLSSKLGGPGGVVGG